MGSLIHTRCPVTTYDKTIAVAVEFTGRFLRVYRNGEEIIVTTPAELKAAVDEAIDVYRYLEAR